MNIILLILALGQKLFSMALMGFFLYSAMNMSMQKDPAQEK